MFSHSAKAGWQFFSGENISFTQPNLAEKK